MPGSVQIASPVGVLPQALFTAFSQISEYACLANTYANGEYQALALVSEYRGRWKQTRRLTPAVMQTLLTFFLAHNGPQIPFYVYDPLLTSPQFSYDATGTATTGRFTVRFEGSMAIDLDTMVRGNCGLELVEVL